jgi:hypothetical protein
MKPRRFFLGFIATLITFLAVNLIAAHYQSDCGIRAVIGLWIPSFKFCADDIVRVGFPFRVIEEGGFAFRSIFDSGALTADVLAGIVLSAVVGWAAQRVGNQNGGPSHG